MARFELIDPAGGPAPPGPWEARPAPAASFGATAEEAQAPVWLVSLPADPALAWAELADAEAGLRAQEAAVAAAPERLRALAAQGGAASFGAAPAGPEARLLALVGELRGEGGESFGAGAAGEIQLSEAQERFRAFVGQVQDAAGSFAVVETRLAERLVARSRVGWTGDMGSLLDARLTAHEGATHRRSVALALRSRAALLRTFAAVVRGATIVALMVSSPAGAVAALPAAWRFVDDLLREQRGRGVSLV
jgi:hypothetical protein